MTATGVFNLICFSHHILMQRLLSFIFLLTIILPASVMAQRLTTSTPVYDCGQVLFRQPITTKFVLHNKSSRQVTIKEVLTSCGCTTAVAKKRTVASGKDIIVDATYDAKQLGHFQKEIWIYEEGQKHPLELILKGVVVTEIKDFSGSYPYKYGQIRGDLNEIEFDDVNVGVMPSKTIHILNTTGETIEPVVMHLPEWLEASVSPTRMAPEQGGELTFTLLSDKIRNMGLVQTSVYLGKYPGDKIAQDKEIPVSAILLPSVQTLDINNPNAPKLAISSTTINRSEMTGKPEKLKGEIIVQNIGRSTLNISSLQMFTIGIQVSLGKTKLEPGETTKLKIQVNDTELQQLANARPRILMITDDPNQPKVIIEIK